MISLPLINARDDLSLWRTHNPSHLTTSPDFDHGDASAQAHLSPTGGTTAAARRAQQQQQTSASHAPSAHTSALLSLAADEANLEQRKQNIRRFGATWLRPVGIAKTYQARMDEDAEREEHEAHARREQMMLELTNAAGQEAAAEIARRQRHDQMNAANEAAAAAAQADRDLDDDVPDASADEADSVDDEDDDDVDVDVDVDELAGEEEEGTEVVDAIDDEDDDEDDGAGEVTFNEDSFIEGGSLVAAQVQRLLRVEEAETVGALQEEQDLDADVPEAGSYQHTDTEAEDEDEDGDESSAFDVSNATGPFTFARNAAPSAFERRAYALPTLPPAQGTSRVMMGDRPNPGTLGGAGAGRYGGRASYMGSGVDESMLLASGSSSLIGSSPVAGRGGQRPAGGERPHFFQRRNARHS